MLKKLMLIISSLSILTLIACSNSIDESNVATTDVSVSFDAMSLPTTITIGTTHVTIAVVTDEIIDAPSVEIDFAQATGGFITEGITLKVTIDQSVQALTLNQLSDDYTHTEFYQFETLPAGTQLIINNFPLGQRAFITYLSPTAPDELVSYYFILNFTGELGVLIINKEWGRQEDAIASPFEPEIVAEIDVEVVEPFLQDEILLFVRVVDMDELRYTPEGQPRSVIPALMFDYQQVLQARAGVELDEAPQGEHLLITNTEFIHTVDIFSLEVIEGAFQMEFQLVERFPWQISIDANTTLIINNYASAGMFPLSAIAFTRMISEEVSVRHYYLIFQDQSDEFPDYRLIPFIPLNPLVPELPINLMNRSAS